MGSDVIETRGDCVVRRIRADEWREFKELRLEALLDSPLAFVEQYATSVAAPDEFWQDRVRRGAAGSDRCVFVAESAGRLVGKTGCFIEPEITDHVSAHIVGVYLTAAQRGGGIADRLFTAVVGWAREEAKADRVRLFVAEGNPRATAFYQRIGFALTGLSMPYPPDESLIEFEMEYRNPPRPLP